MKFHAARKGESHTELYITNVTHVCLLFCHSLISNSIDENVKVQCSSSITLFTVGLLFNALFQLTEFNFLQHLFTLLPVEGSYDSCTSTFMDYFIILF